MATVDTLITDARSFADTTNTAAIEALTRMRQDVDSVGFTVVGFEAPSLPARPAVPDTLVAPEFDPVTLELPSEPGAVPVFQDISAIEIGTAPTLDTEAPTISLPTLPAEIAAFTATLPGLNTDVAFPEAPDMSMTFVAPTLAERAEPVKPAVSLPVFDTQAPADIADDSTDYAGEFIAAYREAAPTMVATLEGYLDAMIAKVNPQFHPQMAAIEAQLSRYLQGGTGLSATVENAIYERARGKGNAEYLRTRSAAWEDAARRGLTLPDGTLNATVAQSRQAASDLNAAGAREIVVMQAEYEQKNLQFAVTQSTSLRQAMLSATLAYHGNLVQINGQALDYAKNILGALVQLAEIRMKTFAARVDARKAEAVLFETRLKSAMAGIELYRAEIQALEAMTRVDVARVEVYKARIDSLQALAGVYRSRIEAVVAQVGFERLKVDIFLAQVQAYGAQVQAKNGEYTGYRAAIEGEQAKASLRAEEVRAFLARMEGWKSEITAKSEVVRAIATTNEARSRQYNATLDGYKAVVGARGEVARTQLENQRQEVISFNAQAQAQEASAKLQAEWYRSVAQVIMENARLGVTTVLQSAAQNIDRSKAVAAMGTSTAQVYSSIAASALSGMNTLVSQQLTE